MPTCFYHSADMDGHCSGAIIRRYCKGDVFLKGVNHGHALNTENIPPGDTVYVVDFSFTEEEMIYLRNNFDLVWIDHHISSIEKLGDQFGDVKGIRQVADDFDTEVARDAVYKRHQHIPNIKLGLRSLPINQKEIKTAACELVWRYCFPDLPIPYLVYLFGKYDVWEHALDPNILRTNFAVRSFDTRPFKWDLWPKVLDGDAKVTEHILSMGKLLEQQTATDYHRRSGTLAFKTTFKGHEVLAANVSHVNSMFFSQFDEDYDFVIMYAWYPTLFDGEGGWKFSMFTDGKKSVDVSEIAMGYGGGGHQGAAGFVAKEIPFKLTGRSVFLKRHCMDNFQVLSPRVINVRHKSSEGIPHVYIGRGSKWGNPFVMGKDGTRDEVIEKYREYISQNQELLESLPELKGATLGCHCRPNKCHGDVLISLLTQLGHE